MNEPVWIDERQAVAINEQLVATFGGLAGGARDPGVLRAALARPLNAWHYEVQRPGLFRLAAAYAFGIARGHVFVDGNKRTAYVVAVTFLALNGVACGPPQPEIVEVMVRLAEGTVSEADFAGWLTTTSTF
ncbi:MAG: type II toxin-antitoxin system death-on-curing family toxin [Alphaproteobacteria bacterium]